MEKKISFQFLKIKIRSRKWNNVYQTNFRNDKVLLNDSISSEYNLLLKTNN